MRNAAVAQSVEHQLPKLRVAGSSPVCRSTFIATKSLVIGMLMFSVEPKVEAEVNGEPTNEARVD